MGFGFLLYGWMPLPWMPAGLRKHIALLGLYTGAESMAALITNSRNYDTTHLPLLLCLYNIVLFYLWLRIPLAEFKTGIKPQPSSDGELQAAKDGVSGLTERIEKEL